MENLASCIKATRSSQNKTQYYMSKLLSVDQSTYSRIERGVKDLTINQLDVIATDFGLEVTQLLDMAQKPPFVLK